jgi:hypothetical protein
MYEGMTLVAGRECGACTVCCTVPSIDKPQIQKKSGATCKHCSAGGCTIYETRPPVCRGFYCAWRIMDIFGEDWRPDKSGVMPYLETDGIAPNFDLSTGIGLMLVGHPLKIVRQKWFQDFVVTGIANSVPLFLSLPGPRGYQAATASLNDEAMLAAVARGTVKDALEAMVERLRRWDFVPAIITHTGNDVSVHEPV